MFADHNSAIAEIVLGTKALTVEDLDTIAEEHERTGKSYAEAIVDLNLIEVGALLKSVANYLSWPYETAIPQEMPESLSSILDGRLANMYGVVPFKEDGHALQLLAEDPFNNAIVEDLSFSLDRDITLVVAQPAAIRELIDQTYGSSSLSVDDAISELSDLAKQESDLEVLVDEAPVIRFVNLVLEQAIRDKASDIHFEPFEDVFRIRYRIDGTLYEMSPSPVGLALSVISRVKVMANLNIAEKRVPQDGRIRKTLDGRPVDLRVSTLPTQYGESVVLRVLDKTVVNLDLSCLGMPDEVYRRTKEIVTRPNGVVIVTGPTGSGKTTTLYSCLKILNTDEDKILTAEDPIEYEIDGIVQLAVNPSIGLTFAHALRSFLRQDPDTLMVGEIRDLETAKIAIQAAQTGHLVLTTLHTNDAPGAITRLVDMGVEPYLIASSLEAVLAQRLIRTLCPRCKLEYVPETSIIDQVYELPVSRPKKFYRLGGCSKCHQLGYKGRKGLFELMDIEDSLRSMILKQSSSMLFKKRAIELGMRTLRQSGIEAIEAGQTTVEEVLTYT